MMQRIATLFLAATLAACGAKTTPAPDTPATVQWDSATAGEVRGVVERGVNSFMQMDVEGVKSVLSQDWASASYETDFENKPIRMATRDDGIKYAEDIFAEAKKMGATLKVDIKNIDCRGTSTLGYCVMDHDVTATVPKGPPMVQPGRATIVLAKGTDGWKWVHWHSSPGPAASK
jgi:ketosteroid isomerase-like protein